MSDREQAKSLIVNFLLSMPIEHIGADSVQRFCDDCEERGIPLLVVFELLLTGMKPRIHGEHHVRYARSGAGGTDGVRKVQMNDEGLEVVSRNRTFTATWLRRGILQWREEGKVVSRDEIEDVLGVWPGYIDAVEDSFKHVGSQCSECKKEQADHWQTVYSTGRHNELRRWRQQNPTQSNEVPDALKGIRHVKRLDVSQPCYVYFLLHKGEVVYVGQTAAPWPGRVLTHLKEEEKQFDDVWYLEVDRYSLTEVENRYIAEFTPKYNTAGNPE